MLLTPQIASPARRSERRIKLRPRLSEPAFAGRRGSSAESWWSMSSSEFIATPEPHALAGLTMLEPSRKHGHYDQRWPAWPLRSTSTTPNGARANWSSDSVTGVRRVKLAGDEEVGLGAIDAWEGEGGFADPTPSHDDGRINRLEDESLRTVWAGKRSVRPSTEARRGITSPRSAPGLATATEIGPGRKGHGTRTRSCFSSCRGKPARSWRHW